MYKRAIEIFYSEEDEGYIAVVPELPGCSAFGGVAEKEGRKIPEPQCRELLTELHRKVARIPGA